MTGGREPGDEVTPPGVEHVITSPLSVARVLWWYGEDDLWAPALELAPVVVAGLAPRFAELRADPEAMGVLWPGAPRPDAHLVVGAIEHLEGRPRPAVRRHRRGSPLPDVLDLDEDERWHDPALAEVLRLVRERSEAPAHGPQPWQLPRLRGRYAAG